MENVTGFRETNNKLPLLSPFPFPLSQPPNQFVTLRLQKATRSDENTARLARESRLAEGGGGRK